MGTKEFSLLSNKIEGGIELAIKRLKDKVKKEGGELVFSKNGKIVRVSANDLK